VPIGIGTAALALASLPAGGRGARRRIDLPGLFTSSLALFALTYALIEGGSKGWTSAGILSAFAVAAASAIAFLVVELRSAEPMMDLSFFRVRAFSGGLLSIGLWAFGVFGIYFYTAIYLQNVLGFSPTAAGAGFVPMALLLAVVAILAPRLEARLGAGPTVAIGLGVMAIAIAGLSTVGEGSTYANVLPWFLIYGLGGGLLIPLTNVIISVLPTERAGMASGMLNVSREVFGLLGVTILGAILSARENAVTGPPLHRFLDGYQFALVIAAILLAVGVPVSLFTLGRRSRPLTIEQPTAVRPAHEPV
jgi:predicted MFS family arabinose efflux permease